MKNINYVVSLVQHDLQDYTTHNLSRFMQWAIYCYKNELRFKVSPSVSVAYLELSAIKTAPLPLDYEYYTKIAINIGNQLFTLTVNNDIPLQRTLDCGEESTPPATLPELIGTPDYIYPYGYWIASSYRAGQYVGEQYSMGGGFNELGYFRIDHENRQINFYNIPTAEIVMEYVSDKNASGDTLIPYAAVEPIRKYVEWQYFLFDRKSPQYEKETHKNLFRRAMAEYRYIETAPTIQDYLDASWADTKSTIKR